MNNDTHPFGYWITAVDRLMKAEFATVFADEGITRRDWRLLNLIDGTVPGGSLPARPLGGPKLRRLADLGWIARSADGWTLTDAGRLAKKRLSTAVDEIRARVAGALDVDEYAAMTASLEKTARAFGWEEGKPLPRRDRDHRRGGRGHHGHHGHGHHGHGHGDGHHHGCGHRHGGHGFRPTEQHIHIHTHAQ